MRAMPHRVASPASVVFAVPKLQVLGHSFAPNEPVTPWDYLVEAVVISSFTVDEHDFLSTTGLSTTSGVKALLQVDCRATGWRKVAGVTFPLGGGVRNVAVHIGPNQVAEQIQVTQAVVLDAPDGPESPDRVAFRRGSRLLPSAEQHRFLLEGDAPSFPTEAFDFGKAGLPRDAAWKLRFEPDSLDEPYSAAVRIFVNSGHPKAHELLSGTSSLIRSVLFYSVAEQLLLTVADSFGEEIQADFMPDSVGEALSYLTSTYLNAPLATVVDQLRNDRSETLCRLQSATAFLISESS